MEGAGKSTNGRSVAASSIKLVLVAMAASKGRSLPRREIAAMCCLDLSTVGRAVNEILDRGWAEAEYDKVRGKDSTGRGYSSQVYRYYLRVGALERLCTSDGTASL